MMNKNICLISFLYRPLNTASLKPDEYFWKWNMHIGRGMIYNCVYIYMFYMNTRINPFICSVLITNTLLECQPASYYIVILMDLTLNEYDLMCFDDRNCAQR
jgi:hypothetical protein